MSTWKKECFEREGEGINMSIDPAMCLKENPNQSIYPSQEYSDSSTHKSVEMRQKI